jgi:hypothetical protein
MPNTSISFALDKQHMGPPVELSDGSRFPAWVEVWAIVDDLSMTLRIVVENGQPILDTFFVGRPRGAKGPLKPATISAIPLEPVLRQAVADVGRLVERAEESERANKRSGRRVDDDLLREVLAVVTSDESGQPNKAVISHFGVSSRTASRWIKAAERYVEDTQGEEG